MPRGRRSILARSLLALRTGSVIGSGMFVAISSRPVAAQNLIGVVTDSARRPLPEADIIIGPSGIRVRSDSAGRFTVRLRNGGRVEVKARLIGFRQFIDTVRVPSTGTERITVRMERLPQRLAARVITDRRQCAEFALSGFECRRDSGIGYFRDAGELRAMQPRNWADMLDGLPGLRRRMKRDGPGWDVGPVPSRCLRAIYNGNMPMWLQHDERVADAFWEPNDVVAIEYYPEYRDVPPQYQRYAWWPRLLGQPCGLIVYWLRGADRTPRDTPRASPDSGGVSHGMVTPRPSREPSAPDSYRWMLPRTSIARS